MLGHCSLAAPWGLGRELPGVPAPGAGQTWGPHGEVGGFALSTWGAAEGEVSQSSCSQSRGDTRVKAGQGVGPTWYLQFTRPRWSLTSPRATSTTGQSCKSQGGTVSMTRPEPDKDTQPSSALPCFPWGREHRARGMAVPTGDSTALLRLHQLWIWPWAFCPSVDKQG